VAPLARQAGMSARVAAILVVLLAVLGGGAIVYYQQEKARRPESFATLGRPLLKELKAADVAQIRIVEPKATLRLERRGERWTIAERAGFPADYAKVREFVLKALELKVGQSEPIGEKDRARLNLDASGTRLEFNAADGKALARLTVGRKYFKSPPENPDRAIGDGRFVMLPGEEKTVYVVSDPLAQATTRSAQWIDTSSFQVERVKTLEVRYPGGESWKIERKVDDSKWTLTPLKPGEKLEVTKANSASYSLGLLDLADVAPKDAKDTGLDKPILVNAATLEGLAYAIKVGKLEGENYYVSFTSGGTLVKERMPEKSESAADKERRDKEFGERIRKIEERLPREKMLSEYVLLIPKSKLEDTLRKRVELLEKKEAKK
jgi:hypothetical protein